MQLRLHCLATLAVALFATAAAAADSTTKTPTEITVDLNSAVLSQTMPFDVEFILSGAIDPAVQQIDVAFQDIGDPNYCPTKKLVNNFCHIRQPWTQNTQPTAATKFTVKMPVLLVNRAYTLRFTIFTLLSGPALDAYRAKAAGNVAGVLATLLKEQGGTFNLQGPEIQQLRKALQDAAATSTVGLVVTPKPGSIFDPAVPMPAFITGLEVPLLQAYLTPRPMAQNLVRFVDRQAGEFAAGVRALAVDQMFLKLGAGARTAADDSRFNALKQEAALAKAYVDKVNEDPATLGPFYTLFDATEGASLDAVRKWTAKDATDALARLQQAVNDVKTLDDVFKNLKTNKDFRSAAGGSDTDVAAIDAVRTKLKDLSDALGAETQFLTLVMNALKAKESTIAAVSENFAVITSKDILLVATTTGDFNTRHSWYISLDLGLAVAPLLHEVFPYAGTNIYFRPVNKEAAIQNFKGRERFKRSFSALVGLTYVSNLTKPGQRANLFNDRMVVVGAGLRVTDSLRLNAGAVLFKAEDTNPTISRQTLRGSPFLSFSFDADVIGAIGKLGELFK